MTLERIAGICFCIVMTSAAAAGQQRIETTRSISAGREVVVETYGLPDVEGRLTQNQEIVTETFRTPPDSAQTIHDVFEVAAGGRRKLLTRTESLRRTLANGDTSVVHHTWIPDLNGRLGLTSRQIEQTRSTASGARQVDTTLLMPGFNETLRETERTEYTERRIRPGLVRYDSTQLVRDVNGRWQPIETRSGEAREIGASERTEEETIQRPDVNGKLGVNERNLTRRFNANQEDHVVIETYALHGNGLFRFENTLALSQRVHRTTTVAPDGGRYTVEEVEARSPVAPSDPMRVISRTVTTVRRISPDRWVTEQQMFERDVNGRLQLVSH